MGSLTNFPNGLTSFGVPVLPVMTVGNTFFVDSATGANTANQGKSPKTPFATLDYAIGRCTASKGNVIIVAAGHTETVTAAIALDVAGITILGLGNGDNRPSFTLTATAAPAITISADDQKIINLRFYCATAGTSYLKNLMRVAASDVEVSNCEFKINQVVTHTVRVVSGDKVSFKDCVFINMYAPGTGAAGVKAQQAILNIGGTRMLVKGCRFNDTHADKAHRWKACVEGGKLTASLNVEDCDFVCRGVATATRTAGASGFMATKFCRGISPSSNTSVGAIFTPTYQYIIETYNVAAVNKVGVVTVTTSDLRFKRDVAYL
jgi:hypothetical protein